ncbi:MAG: glycosyltransferase family 4 protein [Planctomycetes bacterium]|nr:glycosyltransferase family 4 protein [Planctomycetota bacterium]
MLLAEVLPPRTGGSGRWLWEIYRRLPAGEVVIAAGEDLRAAEFDRTNHVNLQRIPLQFSTWGVFSRAGLRAYRRALKDVRRIIKEQRPARVQRLHCARCLPEGWIAWLNKRIHGMPYICYVHGEEANYAKSSRELGWMMRRVLRGADFLIANSRNTQLLLERDWQVPAERIRLLHPGVDCTRFVPMPRDAAIRQRLGWGDRPVVLTVGRLQERKGHDVMIEAVAQIKSQSPDILYSIVGDGEERGRLEQLVRQHGVAAQVEFRGEPTDNELIQCYQQCDLFVLANRQVGQDIEGFGMVLVEAQACGKPVIAGASGGTAETMLVGQSGFVIDCTTPNELSEVIPQLLLDEPRRHQMGAAGRRFVETNLDWESLAAQARVVFREGLPTHAG